MPSAAKIAAAMPWTSRTGILWAMRSPRIDRRHVGEHHAEGRAQHDRHERLVARRQCDGRDLGLVADLGQEEREHCGAEDAEPGAHGRRLVELVGNQHPDGHRDERCPQQPAQDVRARYGSDPSSHGAGDAVVEECSDEDAQHDRHRPAEPGRQDECQELGLVADFRERDDACRNEEGFHCRAPVLPAGGERRDPATDPRQRVQVPRRSGVARDATRLRGWLTRVPGAAAEAPAFPGHLALDGSPGGSGSSSSGESLRVLFTRVLTR